MLTTNTIKHSTTPRKLQVDQSFRIATIAVAVISKVQEFHMLEALLQ
jgi:hypothetical protein